MTSGFITFERWHWHESFRMWLSSISCWTSSISEVRSIGLINRVAYSSKTRRWAQRIWFGRRFRSAKRWARLIIFWTYLKEKKRKFSFLWSFLLRHHFFLPNESFQLNPKDLVWSVNNVCSAINPNRNVRNRDYLV